MSRNRLRARDLAACFIAAAAISAAGAVVLTPATVWWYVIGLGIAAFAVSVVIEHSSVIELRPEVADE